MVIALAATFAQAHLHNYASILIVMALAAPIGVSVDHPHQRIDSRIERRMRWVGHQFVVFDEVDSGFGKLLNEICGVLG